MEDIFKILHDELGWNLTDSLTTTGRKLVVDTLRAQEIIKERSLTNKNKQTNERDNKHFD